MRTSYCSVYNLSSTGSPQERDCWSSEAVIGTYCTLYSLLSLEGALQGVTLDQLSVNIFDRQGGKLDWVFQSVSHIQGCKLVVWCYGETHATGKVGGHRISVDVVFRAQEMLLLKYLSHSKYTCRTSCAQNISWLDLITPLRLININVNTTSR